MASDDDVLEAVLEIELKFGVQWFSLNELKDPPGFGYDMATIMSSLISNGYLTTSRGRYKLTERATTSLKQKSDTWLITHAPFECHSGQK